MAFEALKEACLMAESVRWIEDDPSGPLLVVKGDLSDGAISRLEEEMVYRTSKGSHPGEVRLRVPREKSAFVARNFRDFLSEGCRDLELPSKFYILQGEESDLNDNLQFLEECLSFKSDMDALASHVEMGAWIFLQIKKVVIRLELSPEEFSLGKEKRIHLGKIRAFLSDTSAEHARVEIFKGALITEFRSGRGGPVTTFGEVLSRIDAVQERVETDFALYVHEHGFERLKDEALARKIDTGLKIDKVVSTMEAIGLTIPPAIYVAAKEVERGKGIDLLQLPLSGNAVLTYAAILFAALMFAAFLRQLMLISDLRSDCNSAEESFRERAGQSDEHRGRISKLYKPLRSRLNWSCGFSWIRMLLAFLPLVATVLLGLSDEQRSQAETWIKSVVSTPEVQPIDSASEGL